MTTLNKFSYRNNKQPFLFRCSFFFFRRNNFCIKIFDPPPPHQLKETACSFISLFFKKKISEEKFTTVSSVSKIRDLFQNYGVKRAKQKHNDISLDRNYWKYQNIIRKMYTLTLTIDGPQWTLKLRIVIETKYIVFRPEVIFNYIQRTGNWQSLRSFVECVWAFFFFKYYFNINVCCP